MRLSCQHKSYNTFRRRLGQRHQASRVDEESRKDKERQVHVPGCSPADCPVAHHARARQCVYSSHAHSASYQARTAGGGADEEEGRDQSMNDEMPQASALRDQRQRTIDAGQASALVGICRARLSDWLVFNQVHPEPENDPSLTPYLLSA